MTPGAEQALIEVFKKIEGHLSKLANQDQRLAGELVNVVQELYHQRKITEAFVNAVVALRPDLGPLFAEVLPSSPAHAGDDLNFSPPAEERDLEAVLQVNRALVSGNLQVSQSGLVEPSLEGAPLAPAVSRDTEAARQVNAALAAGAMRINDAGGVELVAL